MLPLCDGARAKEETMNPKDFPDIHGIMDELFATAEDILTRWLMKSGLVRVKPPFMSWGEQAGLLPSLFISTTQCLYDR